MDIFLDETMRLDHIKYLRDVGKYRAISYPRTLPAERQHAITRNQDLLELKERLKTLKIQETAIKAYAEADSQATVTENIENNISFSIKLTAKQIQVLKVRLHNSSLLQYREEWVQAHIEAQVRTGINKESLNAEVNVTTPQRRKRFQEQDKRRTKKRQKIDYADIETLRVIHWCPSPESYVSAYHGPAEIEGYNDSSRQAEVYNELARPQVSQHEPCVPSDQLSPTLDHVHGVKPIQSSVKEGEPRQPCALRPTGGTSGNDCHYAPSSGRSDSVSTVSDLSDLCFANAESDILTINSSPEIPPIDPQLLRISNVPVLGDNKCNSDATVYPCSRYHISCGSWRGDI
ncbi:hypothetical protein FE257_013073 [Aspergillus nanangensis]|uniref:Uncharacterized protein n=1 Tax=Aspergillus nanangensis TaxID=2582783 RepID=A0AAD4CEY7_ASPNN|nr:hypothetical protein FE257_013073 [Aspergillus nanangensis]